MKEVCIDNRKDRKEDGSRELTGEEKEVDGRLVIHLRKEETWLMVSEGKAR